MQWIIKVYKSRPSWKFWIFIGIILQYVLYILVEYIPGFNKKIFTLQIEFFELNWGRVYALKNIKHINFSTKTEFFLNILNDRVTMTRDIVWQGCIWEVQLQGQFIFQFKFIKLYHRELSMFLPGNNSI